VISGAVESYNYVERRTGYVPPSQLDEIDEGILYLLQKNARNNTTTHIGDQLNVSSSTVGNRINKLEDHGIITGYQPTVDYRKAGLGHHLLVRGTVPFEDRSELAGDVLGVHGVVSVRELLTDDRNLSIQIVGDSRDRVEQSIETLNDLGVDIDEVNLVKQERLQPFDNFGQQFTDGE
jgi:DNA-binding Lrp family transcriptional regulator